MRELNIAFDNTIRLRDAAITIKKTFQAENMSGYVVVGDGLSTANFRRNMSQAIGQSLRKCITTILFYYILRIKRNYCKHVFVADVFKRSLVIFIHKHGYSKAV